MKTRIFRFSSALTLKEWEYLEKLSEQCNRPKSNMAESLIKIAINKHRKGLSIIDLRELGQVNETPELIKNR